MKTVKQKIKHLPLNLIKVNCITCETHFQIYTTLKSNFKVDVCSHCHPFYIGTQKFESKAGRVERFRRLQRKRTDILKKLVDNSHDDQPIKKENENV